MALGIKNYKIRRRIKRKSIDKFNAHVKKMIVPVSTQAIMQHNI